MSLILSGDPIRKVICGFKEGNGLTVSEARDLIDSQIAAMDAGVKPQKPFHINPMMRDTAFKVTFHKDEEEARVTAVSNTLTHAAFEHVNQSPNKAPGNYSLAGSAGVKLDGGDLGTWNLYQNQSALCYLGAKDGHWLEINPATALISSGYGFVGNPTSATLTKDEKYVIRGAQNWRGRNGAILNEFPATRVNKNLIFDTWNSYAFLDPFASNYMVIGGGDGSSDVPELDGSGNLDCKGDVLNGTFWETWADGARGAYEKELMDIFVYEIEFTIVSANDEVKINKVWSTFWNFQ